MSNWLNYDPLYVKLHMREMQAAAEEARLARQVRRPRRFRHCLGTLLIRAGEAMIGRPVATPGPEGATTAG